MTEDADALRELGELIDSRGWRPLPGAPGMLIFIHPWPDGSVDTLAVHGADESLAERTNAAGDPVWHREGALTDVLAALRALPAPDAEDAPRLVLPTNSVDRSF